MQVSPVSAVSASAVSARAIPARAAATNSTAANPAAASPEAANPAAADAERPAAAATNPEADQAIRAQVLKLQARDREVRAHEQAHLAAAGRFATSGPSFTFQTGPDGRRYAVGGEVGIDTSPVPDDPEATIAKAQQIRAAALAPAQPSSQDLAVAAKASSMEQRARVELARAERDSGYTANGQRDTRANGLLVSARA